MIGFLFLNTLTTSKAVQLNDSIYLFRITIKLKNDFFRVTCQINAHGHVSLLNMFNVISGVLPLESRYSNNNMFVSIVSVLSLSRIMKNKGPNLILYGAPE